MNNINFDNLNKMIQYIENNLKNDIDINDLAKLVGVSSNSLQRIFSFLTEMSIVEYIKKRRLSKAFEEIKTTNFKIIDIAFKYQYNSVISFDRSFKKAFGITPMECREKNVTFKQFPIIKFAPKEQYKQYDYEIKYIPEQEIYCYKTQTDKSIDLLYKIRELYNYLKINNIHQKLKKEEQYAISFYKNGINYYAVGSKTEYTSKYKIKIPAGKYVVFEVGSREQKDIVNLEKNIYTRLIKSTNIKVNDDFTLEYYIGENCYLCMPIVN